MDAFEHVIATILERDGFWVRTTFKVELTKEDKVAIGRPSSPRWELDLIGYRPGGNLLRIVECKSYLDSRGVSVGAFNPGSKGASRYKLFTEPTTREVVLNRLVAQLCETDTIRESPIAFAVADVAANQLGSYQTEGQASRDDWTDVAGTATLIPGDCYFLSVDEPGKITNVSTATAGEYVVTLGRAIGLNTLDIEMQLPILLSGNVATAPGAFVSTLETFTVTPAQATTGEILLSADGANEFVFVNGLHQILDVDYSLSGSLITFGVGYLNSGDVVAVKYELA